MANEKNQKVSEGCKNGKVKMKNIWQPLAKRASILQGEMVAIKMALKCIKAELSNSFDLH